MDQVSYTDIEQLKNLLPKLTDTGLVLFADTGKIYPHTVFVTGVLNRTQELTESAIWSIESNRPLTSFAIIRGLLETVGLVYYALDKVKTASSAEVFNIFLYGSREPGSEAQSVNILTCIDKATNAHPNLRSSYDQLSEFVHPNSASILYAGRVSGEQDEGSSARMVDFTIGHHSFKHNHKTVSINLTGECCAIICDYCQQIIETVKLKQAEGKQQS